jgi:hypothetical protein
VFLVTGSCGRVALGGVRLACGGSFGPCFRVRLPISSGVFLWFLARLFEQKSRKSCDHTEFESLWVFTQDVIG